MALTSTGSRDCLVPPFTTQQVRYTSATDVPPEYPAGPGGVFTSEAGGAATSTDVDLSTDLYEHSTDRMRVIS